MSRVLQTKIETTVKQKLTNKKKSKKHKEWYRH